jgi:hypothetical protein
MLKIPEMLVLRHQTCWDGLRSGTRSTCIITCIERQGHHKPMLTAHSSAEARFAPGSVHVGFAVEKLALGQGFPPSLSVSPVNIIPPLLHIHSSRPIIWGVHKGPLAAQVHRDIVTPHRNSTVLIAWVYYNKPKPLSINDTGPICPCR